MVMRSEEGYIDRINLFFSGYDDLKDSKRIIKSIDVDFFFDVMDDLRLYVENYRYTEEDIKELLKKNCETMDKFNDILVENIKLKKGNEENDK